MNRTYSIWSTSALFLLPALCMVLRSGYAYGCSILILASVFHIKVWREHRIMPKHGWLLYGSFVYIALQGVLIIRLEFYLRFPVCGTCWLASLRRIGYGVV